MGSPLGPTFANFYMCELENSILCDNQIKPLFYTRYVDDIFLIINNYHELENIWSIFKSKSVLKFTFETEIQKKIPFLDVLVSRVGQDLSTSVYVKETNHGDCLNYNSICPEKYKISVIRALLHRGFHVSSSWNIFHEEVNRIKQLLTNNNYPMALVEETVRKFLSNKFSNDSNDIIDNQINFYYRGQMSSNYKLEEKRLKNIIDDNVTAVHDNDKVSLIIYYRNKKLKNLLISNKPKSTSNIADRHHVVYQYTCSLDGCNAVNSSYVGYTTCTIWERFKMHAQNGSILKHLSEQHAIPKPTRKQLVDNVKILKSAPDRRDLIYTEAILIKDLKPQLNSQNEGCERLLKLFVH